MSNDPKRPPIARAAAGIMSPWMKRLATLDDVAGRAWDERDRRITAGTATASDVKVHMEARVALEAGRRLAPEACRMPGPELSRRERRWHPDSMDNPERAVHYGIPPLIAEEIAAGEGRSTRSTRACDRVGVDYLVLILVGAHGCGKTYAAARWLWKADHERFVPFSIRRAVLQRRFVEANALKDIPFEDRPQLGTRIALVVDDLGAEQDFMYQDWARVIALRYRNGLPTVITTNLSEDEFGATYGVRVVDRLREVGRFVVVSNSAADSLRGR